ncbi:hypothetical protein C2G38_2235091 [Gigaspora rosea]|uniref:Uncharacterized protein n=1 Tax=Gigaspora rosea TaxID=44941 RepID=A0A397TZH6_9GLOM|nr:hypothetical protein C2G38_2235091 [Gigaspora rosea]
MEDITKYLIDYIPQEKMTDKQTTKRSLDDKNADIQISDIENNKFEREEELEESTKNKTNNKKFSLMFCNTCKNACMSSLWTTTGSEWLKEDCIEKHEKSTKHIKAINSKSQNQLTIKEDDIEFTTSTSSTNYALYKNAVAGRELLSSIFTIIEENVISEVKKSPCWSLLVDESNTNIISKKTIALVSKHLVNGEPIFCFLGLTQITDAIADEIMNIINHFIKQKGLDIAKLRHFGSDGAVT